MISGVRSIFGSHTSTSSCTDKPKMDLDFEIRLGQLKDKLRPLFKSNPTQSHDDRSLARFLTGAGSVDSAYADIVRYNNWRLDQQVDSLSPTDPDILEQLSKGCVHALKAKDVDGRPILYVMARKHESNNRDLENMVKFTVYMLELSLSRMNEQVNDTLCLVFDLHNFSLSNMDYPFIRRLLWMLTKFYPERLGVCLLYGAPTVFQGCWPVIRHWLHDRTAKKVIFVNRRESMERYIDLDVLPPLDM